MIAFVAANPETGDIVPGAGGIRKFRWGANAKGKRGGVRVIYYLHSKAFPIFLLTIYAKNQKANLTKAERSDMKALVPLLIRNYRRGRQK